MDPFKEATMRRTTSARTAAERIAPLVAEHGVKMTPVKRGFRIKVPASKLPGSVKTTVRALAFAADILALHHDEAARDMVRWTGYPPS
jgi:hypothetical protein